MKETKAIDMKVTVDTVHLVTRLTYEEKEFIHNRFTMNNGNEFFRYSLTSKKPRFTIYLDPRNRFAKRHYNAMIMIQHETLAAMPVSLAEILAEFDWKFKRLDIAFDSKLDFDKHVFIKNHGNVETWQDDDNWHSYYIGSKASKTKLNAYDRNKRQEENGSAVRFQHGTRFEIRIKPKLTGAGTIHNINSEILLKELAKYIIVEDASLLNTSQWNINRLYNLKDNLAIEDDYKNRWERYGKHNQQELKMIAKQNRIPFEDLFMEQIDNLFQWTQRVTADT